MQKMKHEKMLETKRSSAFIHSLVVKKVYKNVNVSCVTRRNLHKVEVIFSAMRLANHCVQRNDAVFSNFTLCRDYSIIPYSEMTALREVEYWQCGLRRKSMKKHFFLWTAYQPISSHFSIMPACFTMNASSAETTRGNMRYIAKFRLMKGENA